MTIDWPTQILIFQVVAFGIAAFGSGLFVGIKLGQTKQTTILDAGHLNEKQEKQLEQPFRKHKGFRSETKKEDDITARKTYTIN